MCPARLSSHVGLLACLHAACLLAFLPQMRSGDRLGRKRSNRGARQQVSVAPLRPWHTQRNFASRLQRLRV